MSMKTYRACFAYDAPRYRAVAIKAHSSEEAIARAKVLAQSDDFWEEYDEFEAELDFDACRVVYIDRLEVDGDDNYRPEEATVAEDITDFTLTEAESLALALGSVETSKSEDVAAIIARIRELVGQLEEVTNGN